MGVSATVPAPVTVDLSHPGRVGSPRADAGTTGARVSREGLAIIAITVVAAALRFITLTHQSLWFDEAQAVHEMRLSFGSMLHAWSASEPNPPLYFVLAWPWAKIFGDGAGGLRSLSAIAGTVTVPLAYLAARQLVSRRAGVLAAAFAALSPFMIWYSQEAREYMLVTALSAASLVFFARVWTGSGRRGDVVGWAVFAALALLTQYFAIFLVGAEALALLYRRRDRAIGWALAGLALVEATLIPHLVAHASRSASWIGLSGLSIRVRQVPVAFGFSPQYQSSSALSYGLLAAALLVALMIGLLVIGADANELRGAGIAGALAAAVVLIPLVAALVGHDYYVARALIPGWIPLAVAVAAGCAARGAQRPGAALAVLLCALFVYGAITIDGNAAYQRPNWRGVAAALGPAHGLRAIVDINDGTFATAPLAVYLPGVDWTGPLQIPQVSDAAVTAGELDIIGVAGQSIARPAGLGATLIATRRVGGHVVDRFRLTRPVPRTPSDLAAVVAQALGTSPPSVPGSVLIQRSSD